MAYFDDIGKRISQAGHAVAKKTKDVTGVARLKGAIIDEEKKINCTYTEIGKLFVKKCADTDDLGFVALLNLIKESEEKIEDYRRQILDIKGIARCAKCGAEVASGTAFCSSCGNAMAAEKVEDDKVICSACGAELASEAKFCISCGTRVEERID